MVFASTRREDIEKSFIRHRGPKPSLQLPCFCCPRAHRPFRRVRPVRILVPVKARIDHVRERAAFVTHMAKAFGAKVYVFHTPRPIETIFSGEIHLPPPEWEKRMSHDISQVMRCLQQQEYRTRGEPPAGKDRQEHHHRGLCKTA